MKDKKILLTTLNSKYIHTNIALRYLKKILDTSNFNTVLKEFTINDEFLNILASITDENPDILAFATYIWNIEITLKLAKTIKNLNPNIKIILGGPEVTYCSEQLLKENNYIDYIIIGEGEKTVLELIKNIINKDVFDIDNVSYYKNNELKIGNIGVNDKLENLPSIVDFDLKEENKNKIVYFETVRGCPYNCSYCLSSTIKGIREIPIEKVKQDLKVLMDNNIKLIKLTDRTFNYNKKRAMEIWEYIVKNNKNTEFHFEISAHLIDNTMLEFLKTVPKNMFRFEIGVQSTNPKTIEAINRKTDFTILSNIVRQIKSFNNITLHLDLIAGLPYEDYNSFKNSFNDVYNLEPDELQLGFLKLLKGCRIREQEAEFEYRYIQNPPYEILQNKFISYEEIKKLKKIEDIVDKYYNSSTFKISINYIIKKYFKSAIEFYEELSKFYLDKKYFERKISGEESFDILFEFFTEKISENIEYFRQILKLDYVAKYSNKRMWLDKQDANIIKNEIRDILIDERKFKKISNIFEIKERTNMYKHLKFEKINLEEDEINKFLEKYTIKYLIYDGYLILKK